MLRRNIYIWANAALALVGGTLFFVLPTGIGFLSHILISAHRPAYDHFNLFVSKTCSGFGRIRNFAKGHSSGVVLGFGACDVRIHPGFVATTRHGKPGSLVSPCARQNPGKTHVFLKSTDTLCFRFELFLLSRPRAQGPFWPTLPILCFVSSIA